MRSKFTPPTWPECREEYTKFEVVRLPQNPDRFPKSYVTKESDRLRVYDGGRWQSMFSRPPPFLPPLPVRFGVRGYFELKYILLQCERVREEYDGRKLLAGPQSAWSPFPAFPSPNPRVSNIYFPHGSPLLVVFHVLYVRFEID
eukprot:714679-Amorphochlora_amoeboformis.AAC.1